MRSFDEVRTDVKKAFRAKDEPSLLRLADELDALDTGIAKAWASNVRGTHAVWTGSFDAAITHFTIALDRFAQVDHVAVDASSVQSNLGTVYARMGDHVHAIYWFRQALEAFLERRDRENAANVYINLGVAYFQQTEFAPAMEMFVHALDIYEQLGERSGIRTALSNIGSTYTDSGDLVNGLSYFLRALEMFEADGLDRRAVDPLNNIGVVYRNIGRYEEAVDHQLRALDLVRTARDRYAEISILRELGSTYALRKMLDEACTWFQRSYETAKDVGAQGEEAHSLVLLCSALVQADKHDEASHLLHEHRALVDAHRLPRVLARVVQSSLLRHDGDLRGALALLQEAIDELTALNIPSALEDALEKATGLARELADFELYIKWSEAHQRLKDEIRGQDATRRLTMLEAEQRIQAERAETERHRTLLHATLPPSIAERVMRGETVNDSFDCAAVMFIDMVGFTTMSASMPPDEVVRLLSEIFTMCDAIVAEHGLMKIKTIGDSYMSVAFDGDVALRTARAARAMLVAISDRFPLIHVRVGIHCGPVTAGVIGTERLQYDVWGDTVNVASRMESTGDKGRIHVSAAFAAQLDLESRTNDDVGRTGVREFRVRERGAIDVKGKGSMVTCWLTDADGSLD